jgi:spore germination protein YaaH
MTFERSFSLSTMRISLGMLLISVLFVSGAGHALAASKVVISKIPPKSTVSAASTLKTLPSSPFEVSGWIPYWRTATGTADVVPHLSQFTEIDPFGYTVKTDGSLYDALKVGSSTWQGFFTQARAQHVRLIATVMWSDTDSIHTVLSDPAKRAAHVQGIVDMLTQNNFDGVDIDYEGKKSSDKPYYSAFLKELSTALSKKNANKWLMCTIEARTPPDSLNTKKAVTEKDYANDYVVINKYCDRVRLMTYDQEAVDKKLNDAHNNELYAPIADPAWIQKVITLTEKTIDKKKIVLGVATYGYIYQVIPASDGSGYNYTLLEAFNPKYATDTAAAYGITPTRNAAGELSFTYVPKDSPTGLSSQAQLEQLAPAGTAGSNLAAAGALALVKSSGHQTPVQMLWWSDAQAIQAKVTLAKQLGLRGVAIFKLDGGEDQGIWNAIK